MWLFQGAGLLLGGSCVIPAARGRKSTSHRNYLEFDVSSSSVID